MGAIAQSEPQTSSGKLSPEQIADEIFKLLRDRGPLCASQISAELLFSLKEVIAALELLRAERAVDPRTDRGRPCGSDDVSAPWGLPKVVR